MNNHINTFSFTFQDNSQVFIKITTENNDLIRISGNYLPKFLSINNNYHVIFWAANPNDKKISFYASELPFPSYEIAYDHTINRGIAHIINGYFSFTVIRPNSYYENLGSKKIESQVNFTISNKNHSHQIVTIPLYSNPFRLLTYPSIRNATFYQSNKKIKPKTQHEIMKDCSYQTNITRINDQTNKDKSFWGNCIPH